MKRPSPFRLRLLCLALLLPVALASLLPSCGYVKCRIGENIRRGGESYVGIDVRHPVDGLIYTDGSFLADGVYVRAPEIRYTLSTPFITEQLGPPGHRTVYPEVKNAEPTGRIVIARVRTGYRCAPHSGEPWTGIHTPWSLVEVVPELPAGVRAVPAESTPHSRYRTPQQRECPLIEENIGQPRLVESAGTLRRLAAAPFDYAIDPLLTATGTILGNAAIVAYQFVGIPYTIATGNTLWESGDNWLTWFIFG